MKTRKPLFEKFLLLGLVFLVPTQLAFHFWPSWAFVFGIRVDYLAPTVYLTDLFLAVIISRNLYLFKKHLKIFLVVLLLALVNTLFSSAPAVSFIKWLRIFELSAFALYIREQKTLDVAVIFRTLFYSAIFFSLIGIIQFVKGETIGSLFYFLGERTFSLGTPGIALVKITGQNFLRAYSTFSHPNSLAGFLGVVLILSFAGLRKNLSFFLGAFIVLVGFILTFSLSAFIGILVIAVLQIFFGNKNFFRKLIFLTFAAFTFGSLILPFFSAGASVNLPRNIYQRLDLAYISGKMVSQRFLIGEGVGSFVTNIPRFRGLFSYSWSLQPVHNVFLLMLSEIGMSGLLVFLYLIYKSVKTSFEGNKVGILLAILFVVVTGSADHYWLTLQQNMVLLSLLLGLSFRIGAWTKV